MPNLHKAIQTQDKSLFLQALLNATASKAFDECVFLPEKIYLLEGPGIRYETLEERDENGFTAVQIAAGLGAMHELLLLIESGASLDLANDNDFLIEMKRDSREDFFKSALYLALENDHIHCAMLLKLLKADFKWGLILPAEELIKKYKNLEEHSTYNNFFKAILIASVSMQCMKLFKACINSLDKENIPTDIQALINGLFSLTIINNNSDCAQLLFPLVNDVTPESVRPPLYWIAKTKLSRATNEVINKSHQKMEQKPITTTNIVNPNQIKSLDETDEKQKSLTENIFETEEKEKPSVELQSLQLLKHDEEQSALAFLLKEIPNFNIAAFHYTPITKFLQHPTLTKTQNLIYHSVARGKIFGAKAFRKLKNIEENIATVLHYAMDHHDYVAVHNLLALQLDYAKIAMLSQKADRYDCVILLIASNTSFYNVLKESYQGNVELNKSNLDYLIVGVENYNGAVNTALAYKDEDLLDAIKYTHNHFSLKANPLSIVQKFLNEETGLISIKAQKIRELENELEQINDCIYRMVEEVNKLKWWQGNDTFRNCAITFVISAIIAGLCFKYDSSENQSLSVASDIALGPALAVALFSFFAGDYQRIKYIPSKCSIFPSKTHNLFSDRSINLLSNELLEQISSTNLIDINNKTIGQIHIELKTLSRSLESKILALKISLPKAHGFFKPEPEEIKIQNDINNNDMTMPLLGKNS